MNAPPEMIEAAKTKQSRDQEFLLFEDCLLAYNVFTRLNTQWRHRPLEMGSVACGLDYAVLPTVFRLLRVPEQQESQLFEDIQVMEAEMIEIIKERKA